MHKPLPSIESLISRNAKEVSEISQVYLRAGWNELTAVINWSSSSLVEEVALPWMPEVFSLANGEERQSEWCLSARDLWLRQLSLLSAPIQSRCQLFLQSQDLTLGIWLVGWKNVSYKGCYWSSARRSWSNRFYSLSRKTAKENCQTAALISHDLTRNNELAFSSTSNL